MSSDGDAVKPFLRVCFCRLKTATSFVFQVDNGLVNSPVNDTVSVPGHIIPTCMKFEWYHLQVSLPLANYKRLQILNLFIGDHLTNTFAKIG